MDEALTGLCVMAVGPSDVGKTSCLQQWHSSVLEKGASTVFVDCDVGGGTVPGCVTATVNGASPPCAMCYFGDFSVGGDPERFKRMVTCLAPEVRARQGDGCTCFVDSGVLDRDTLQFLVAAFAVDVVVDFGAPADVFDGATCRVISAPVMAAAPRRTASDRRRARHEALEAFFGDVHTEMVLPFDAVHLRRTDGRVAAPDGEGDALLHQVMGVSSAGAAAGVHAGEPLAITLAKVLHVDMIARHLVVALPCNVSPASLPRPCRLTFGRMQWWS